MVNSIYINDKRRAVRTGVEGPQHEVEDTDGVPELSWQLLNDDRKRARDLVQHVVAEAQVGLLGQLGSVLGHLGHLELERVGTKVGGK